MHKPSSIFDMMVEEDETMELLTSPIGNIDIFMDDENLGKNDSMSVGREDHVPPCQEFPRSASPSLQNLSEWDVPIGRAQQVRDFIGNVRYRQIIEKYRDIYRKASQRTDKSLISTTIYNTVKSHGGRFLDRRSEDTEWQEISEEKAVQKISQALRMGSRRPSKQSKNHSEENSNESFSLVGNTCGSSIGDGAVASDLQNIRICVPSRLTLFCDDQQRCEPRKLREQNEEPHQLRSPRVLDNDRYECTQHAIAACEALALEPLPLSTPSLRRQRNQCDFSNLDAVPMDAFEPLPFDG